jgi:hypothetical protein
MDVEIIVQAFIVVGFSLFSAFALMAVILVIRPWGLFGRPL